MFTPHGVIPALITPLDAEGELLEEALRKLLDYVIEGGVHGVFVLGTSGEIYGLSTLQKRRVLEITVEQVAGRVPIYAGASEITTRDCIATAKMAAHIGGISALSVLTPYMLVPTQKELVDHYRAIAAATDLPVILYSNPGRTKVPVTVHTAVELAAVDTIIGIKDSSGDFTLLTDYLRETPDDFSVLVGRDTLIYGALCEGAAGAIASTANVAPHLVSSIYEAYQSGDLQRARTLQNLLTPLRNLVDKATFPVILKESLRYLGIDVGYCFKPAGGITPDVRRELEAVVTEATAPLE